MVNSHYVVDEGQKAEQPDAPHLLSPPLELQHSMPMTTAYPHFSTSLSRKEKGNYRGLSFALWHLVLDPLGSIALV